MFMPGVCAVHSPIFWAFETMFNANMANRNRTFLIKSCFKKYPRWESNPNLKFRKLPFYPLNYKGISGCKNTNFLK